MWLPAGAATAAARAHREVCAACACWAVAPYDAAALPLGSSGACEGEATPPARNAPLDRTVVVAAAAKAAAVRPADEMSCAMPDDSADKTSLFRALRAAASREKSPNTANTSLSTALCASSLMCDARAPRSVIVPRGTLEGRCVATGEGGTRGTTGGFVRQRWACGRHQHTCTIPSTARVGVGEARGGLCFCEPRGSDSKAGFPVRAREYIRQREGGGTSMAPRATLTRCRRWMEHRVRLLPCVMYLPPCALSHVRVCVRVIS